MFPFQAFAMGVAYRQGTLTPLDIWSRPILISIVMFYLLQEQD